MDDQQKDQEVFRQNLNEKGNFQTLFQIYLLFTEKGSRPDGKEIQKGIIIQIRKGRYSSQREGFSLNFCYLEIHRGIQG